MALTAYITPKELERQALMVFAGKNCKVWAAYNKFAPLGLGDTSAAWRGRQIGSLIEATIATGVYNEVMERYELPPIVATFAVAEDGVPITFDTICTQVNDSTYLHSIQIEDPEVEIQPGSYRTYLIHFAQDDGPNVPLPAMLFGELGRFYLFGGEAKFRKEFGYGSSVAEPGAFSLEGQQAGLWKEHAPGSDILSYGRYRLQAAGAIGSTYTQKAWGGRFVISGEASLIANTKVTAASFTLTGGDATLSESN